MSGVQTAGSGVSLLVCEKSTFEKKKETTHGHMHYLANLCQFFKMGSANARLRHFVTGFSLSKGVRVMVECNPIKETSRHRHQMAGANWRRRGGHFPASFRSSQQQTATSAGYTREIPGIYMPTVAGIRYIPKQQMLYSVGILNSLVQ